MKTKQIQIQPAPEPITVDADGVHCGVCLKTERDLACVKLCDELDRCVYDSESKRFRITGGLH